MRRRLPRWWPLRAIPATENMFGDLNAHVPIEIAYGGTCTAGKNEDMDMYAAVLGDALKQDAEISKNVEFWIQFGSQETREYSRGAGIHRDI